MAVAATEIAPLRKYYRRRTAREVNKRKFNQPAEFHLARAPSGKNYLSLAQSQPQEQLQLLTFIFLRISNSSFLPLFQFCTGRR